MNHILPEMMIAYIDKQLEKVIADEIERHLQSCKECRNKIEELLGLESIMKRAAPDEYDLPDVEVPASLSRAFDGDTSEQVLFMCHGSGANGKTTFQGVMQALLGDYSKQADASAFMVKRAGSPSNDIARLAGVRFVAVTEVDEGRRMAEALVKAVTGEDKIVARYLYAEHFEFTTGQGSRQRAVRLFLVRPSRST